MTEIHSCSYYCTRPACVLAQRDELRGRFLQQAERVDKWLTDDLPQVDKEQAEPAFEYRAAHAFNEGMSITISGHESPTGSFDGEYKVKSLDDEIGNPSW